MSRLRVSQLLSLSFAAALVGGTCSAAVAGAADASTTKTSAKAPSVGSRKLDPAAQRALPLVFEENAGQLPTGAAFAGRTANYTVQVRPTELQFGLLEGKGIRRVKLAFLGGEAGKAVGMTDAGFRTNFIFGSDPNSWHTGVKNFSRVALRGLYPGVDAEFYSTGNEIEHDFIVAPGADASALAMRLSGAENTKLSAEGDVVLSAGKGALKLRKPYAYQVLADGRKQAVDAEFALQARGDGSDLTFKLGAYDHARQLVIDPVITYATYVAGDQGSVADAVASDGAGNVYIAGTTQSSSVSFGSTATPTVSAGLTTTDAPPAVVTFLARLSRATPGSTPTPVNGSQIAWLTYYGDGGATPVDVIAHAIALRPGMADPTIYIAGQTTSKALPGATTHNALSTGSSVYGFVASFNSTDGTTTSATNATYVDGGNEIPGISFTVLGVPVDLTTAPAQPDVTTLLNTIAVETTGAVTVGGSTTGTQYNGKYDTTNAPYPLVIPSDFCSGAGRAGNQQKGLLATFPAALGAPSYSSYVCGQTPGTVNSDRFTLTGVAPSTASNSYIIAGFTDLDFPLYGAYPAAGADANQFFHPGGAGVANAFAASITYGATNVLNWSYWSDGDATDRANGLTIDSSGTNPAVLIYGDTQTAAFTSKSEISNPASAPPATNTTSGYNTFNGTGQQVGFVLNLDAASGAFQGVSLLQGDGTSATTVRAGIADGAGNVLLTGSTNGTKASFPEVGAVAPAPAGSSPRPATVTTFPMGEDISLDPAVAGGSYTNGFLVRMPSTLASADYAAFFGPAAATGASVGVGVALDTVVADNSTLPGTTSSPLAYVLLNETTGGAHSFTTSSAEEQVPQTAATNAAYLAQVGFVAPSATASFSYTPATNGTFTPNPVGYSTDVQSTLTLNWAVHVADAGTSQLVFNLPQTQYLGAYTLSEMSVVVGTGSNVATSVCTTGVVNATANPAFSATAAGPGITCVIPQVPAAAGGTIVTFQLAGGPLTSAAPTGVGSFSIGAAAYDATGNSADLTQTITTAGVPTLTVTAAASPALVNAASSPTQTDAAGNLVTVTYTYTVSNTSDYDSPKTKLVTNLNTSTPGLTLLSSAVGKSSIATCDPTTATDGCDVGPHSSITYTVTGVYLDTNFASQTTAGPYTVTQALPYVTFSSPLTNAGNIYPISPTGPSVQVNGTTTITASQITTNAATYKDGFQLGDQDVEFTASFKNAGNNVAGSFTATLQLLKGYTATSSNCPGAVAPYTSCTFTNVAPGATVSFTVTGKLTDTGSSNDAVAPPTIAADPVTGVKSSETSHTYTTTAVNTVTSGTTSGTYIPPTTLTSTSVSVTVYRANALTYAITAATPLSANTVNELGPLHATYPTPADQVTYTAVVRNTGRSIARGLYFTVPVPATTSGTTPVVTLSPVAYSAGTDAPEQLSCSATASAITCVANDLATASASSATPSPSTAAPQTYTIQFTTSYDETAVPQNVKTTQVTQGAGALYVAADGFKTAATTVPSSVTSAAPAGTASVITIQRLTSIVSKVGVSAFGSAAGTNYVDKNHITLDSNPSGNAPGTFDTILFQSSTSNMGPNDAAGLTISIPVPALTRVAVPQYCTLNGVTGPSATLVTVAAASTMTCATPAFSTTASSTATNQLRAAAGACPAAPAPSGAALSATAFDSTTNCFSVAFYGKYQDAATVAGTVVGANATANVNYAAASITENDIDTPSTPAPTTVAAVLTVQRAAHLKLAAPVAVPTYTTGAALSADANGVAQVAQAALHMDPVTRQVTTGKVYNCLRYTVSVTNEGPNFVLNPTLSYAETPTTFVPTQITVGTAPLDTSSVDCATHALPGGTVLSPLAAGAMQSAFVDGYFDVGSLVAANSGTASFTTGNFSLAGYQDSDTAGTAATDYASTRSITLVNTPYTDANNQKFGITAYGTTPQATLIFTSVTAPGITSAFAANSINCTAPAYDATHPAPPANVNICFPYAKSPLPADNGVVRNLYQPGKTPQYYQLPTTATVPTAAANPTSVCFAISGGAFTDVFVKPERVLLWLMANASVGTNYNSIPTITSSTLSSPLAYRVGDVTSFVTPYLPTATSPSYLKVPAAFTFPQIPQAQPNQICGTVNGFVTTTKADASVATSAETFGVLEPVNFPPVVVAGSIATSNSVSKGSTSALYDIYLRRSIVSGGVVTTKYTYDYNDNDPCYIASAPTPRQNCDDNPYLYTATFTGLNSSTAVTPPTLVTALAPESVTSAPASSYTAATNINLSTSTNVFVSVADQATGADSYNADIASAPGYSANPFVHQGNFLSANYSIANHSSQPALCDPGTSAVGGYSIVGGACAGGVGGNVSGSYRYIRGGQKDTAVLVNYTAPQDLAGGYFALGNVGALSVTASNLAGSGLIPLPYPAPDPTTPNNPAPTTVYPQNPGGSPSNPLGTDPSSNGTTAAVAPVTAGQTAGFIWPWLASVTQAQGIANGALPNDKYDLACILVDSATQQTSQPLPAGVTCNISTSTPTNAGASPLVYTFADPTVSPANGSSSPTIYISTAGGTLYGSVRQPGWKQALEGLSLAMLFPVLFFRKRLGNAATLAVMFLMLAAAPLLTGCGSGGSSSSGPTGPTTPTGNYLFRVTATPESTAHGEAKITSAVFEVSVR